jgi:uncharacterized membrane protein YgcG
MLNLFNASPSDLDSKLNNLESKIQQAQSTFSKPSKNDWDYIFELCTQIAEDFKNVRYSSKPDREVAWQKFYRLRNQAFEARRNQSQNHSEKYFEELMSRLKSVDYDKLGDFIFGDVLSGGLLKTKADEMKAAGRELGQIISYFKTIKYEMVKEHSNQVQERINAVRQHHYDFWEKYKGHQVEKQKEWEARKAEKERKQREWEARKSEKERKQIERERKQKEWEARQEEKERKQREWQVRQEERERKQREWQDRQRERERRQQEYQDRKQYRGGGGGYRGGGGGGSRGGGGGNKGGGCYITTATCIALNKNDFCEELMAFRRFRDTWLLENYPELINEYYLIAPSIVDKIDQENNNINVYKGIWEDYLSECFHLIKTDAFEEAKRKYVHMVKDLQQRFG